MLRAKLLIFVLGAAIGAVAAFAGSTAWQWVAASPAGTAISSDSANSAETNVDHRRYKIGDVDLVDLQNRVVSLEQQMAQFSKTATRQ